MARTPAADILASAVTAQPVADVVAVTLDGVQRLTLTASELAQLIYGPPVTAADERRQRDRIVSAWNRGEIRGRMAGNGLLIPGAAVVDYLRWLGGEESTPHLKTA